MRAFQTLIVCSTKLASISRVLALTGRFEMTPRFNHLLARLEAYSCAMDLSNWCVYPCAASSGANIGMYLFKFLFCRVNTFNLETFELCKLLLDTSKPLFALVWTHFNRQSPRSLQLEEWILNYLTPCCDKGSQAEDWECLPLFVLLLKNIKATYCLKLPHWIKGFVTDMFKYDEHHLKGLLRVVLRDLGAEPRNKCTICLRAGMGPP